jgi:hypothetical protein
MLAKDFNINLLLGYFTNTWPMDLNFPVFAKGVCIFRASNINILFA